MLDYTKVSKNHRIKLHTHTRVTVVDAEFNNRGRANFLYFKKWCYFFDPNQKRRFEIIKIRF